MNAAGKWPFVTNGLIFGMSAGDSIPAKDVGSDGPFPLFGSNGIRGYVTKTNQEEPTLLVGRQGSVGTVHATNGPCWVSEHALRVYPRMPVEVRWLAYSLISARLADLSHGTAQPGISAGAVLREKTLLPDLPTQRRIADYLDRETAQIDAMAGALDGLVARLEERRQAIIAHHVSGRTGGDVQGGAGMKTPQFVSLGHIVDNLDHLRIPLNATERATRKGDFPYWGANNIVDYIDDYSINEPVVLIGEDGAPFLETGRNVAFSVNGPIWPNNHIHVMRPLEGHSPDYIAYALNTVDYSLYVTGSTRLKLTRSSLDRIRIPYYDLPTQRRIVAHLDTETAKIDAMIARAGELRALLNERRSALITATVTGQHPVPEEP